MDSGQEKHLELIYKQVGEIIFISQQMEYNLIYSLTTLKQLRSAQELDDGFDDSMRLFSKKTLGVLIKKMNKHLTFNDDEIKALELALDERNYVVHEFYRNNVERLTTAKGREKCLQRLQEVKNHMDGGSWFLDTITQAVMKMGGKDHEKIVAELKMKLGV